MNLLKENLPSLVKKYKEMYLEELSWGVKPGELSHLIGRLGEFECALDVDGDMAIQCNQPGYDVVSKDGKRISVKTTTRINSGTIEFNKYSLDFVDEIYIAYIDLDGTVHKLIHKPTEVIEQFMIAGTTAKNDNKRRISVEKILGNFKYEDKLDEAVDTIQTLRNTFYLLEDGMCLVKDKDDIISISSKKYFDEALDHFGLTCCSSTQNRIKFNMIKRYLTLLSTYKDNIKEYFHINDTKICKLNCGEIIKVKNGYPSSVSLKELLDTIYCITGFRYGDNSYQSKETIFNNIYKFHCIKNKINDRSNILCSTKYENYEIVKIDNSHEVLVDGNVQYKKGKYINEICAKLGLSWKSKRTGYDVKINKIKKVLA